MLVRLAITPIDTKLVPEGLARAGDTSHISNIYQKVPSRLANADEASHFSYGWEVAT